MARKWLESGSKVTPRRSVLVARLVVSVVENFALTPIRSMASLGAASLAGGQI